jgi:hypothetical protein
MKALSAIVGFLVKMIASSFLWAIIALLGSFPLALLLLKIMDGFIKDNNAFYAEINNEMLLLYLLFTLTCFVGILLARLVAVSIKVLANKKLALKSQKS